MPFDSNGTFNREIVGGWQADRDAGTKITALRHDDEDDGFATGLSECITRTGKTTVLDDIPWNNKKITNLGEPEDPSDAATRAYVDGFRTFNTGLVIEGAGPVNGFLSFKSPTGVNGIGWWNVDMSWIGRIPEPDKHDKRLAVNNTKDGTGADVFIIDGNGTVVSNGEFANNAVEEGVNIRVPLIGLGTLFKVIGGALTAFANDVATTTAYQIATLRQFFRVSNTDGTVILELNKSASGKYASIYAKMADKLRWRIDMGNATAETATERVGSDFYLHSYNNLGTVAFSELSINRATHKASFGGEIYAPLMTTSQNFDSVSTVCIVSATSGGSIRLRPDGPTVTTSSCMIDTNGSILIAEGDATPAGGVYAGWGLRQKAGYTGGYSSSYWSNFYWDGTGLVAYSNNTNHGRIAWQCDYRFKKNIKVLPSTWDKVKSLRPISFQQKKWDIFESNDTVRWGFVAHELQEHLIESAASGRKDEENVVQSPDMLAIIAALTRALQEAQLRIEALEAA